MKRFLYICSRQKLKNKISAIITTNYDQFLEKYIFSNDYTVFVNQREMFSSRSYNIAEIYKIHGSIADPNSIVITEKDYENFDVNRKLFIAKMLTLFAESPIVFIGYSFTDENIQKIVSDFLSCLDKNDLDKIYNHIINISTIINHHLYHINHHHRHLLFYLFS